MTGYDYETEKPKLFTEEGPQVFIAFRDRAISVLNDSGAFMYERVERGVKGIHDTWMGLACIDRMVELGEVEDLSPEGVWRQHRIYARPWQA